MTVIMLQGNGKDLMRLKEDISSETRYGVKQGQKMQVVM